MNYINNRIRVKSRKTILFAYVCACILLMGVLILIRPDIVSGNIVVKSGNEYRVSRVIDGDTFEIRYAWKKATVRMLGIDTPETVDPRKPVQCFGEKAKEETRLLIQGKKVRLVFSARKESKDRYHRYLAYVYAGDTISVNEHLLRDGFAREYTFGTPYDKQADFIAAQHEAIQRRTGLWKEC